MVFILIALHPVIMFFIFAMLIRKNIFKSCDDDMQLYRLYLLLICCKGFLMMINFKILQDNSLLRIILIP